MVLGIPARDVAEAVSLTIPLLLLGFFGGKFRDTLQKNKVIFILWTIGLILAISISAVLIGDICKIRNGTAAEQHNHGIVFIVIFVGQCVVGFIFALTGVQLGKKRELR